MYHQSTNTIQSNQVGRLTSKEKGSIQCDIEQYTCSQDDMDYYWQATTWADGMTWYQKYPVKGELINFEAIIVKETCFIMLAAASPVLLLVCRVVFSCRTS